MDYYIGEIRSFAGNYAPTDWLICDGSALSINDYQILYSLIGLTYGGNSVSFNLPDLRGKLVVGKGLSDAGINYLPGMTGGSKTSSPGSSLPAHNHVMLASSDPATASSPNGNFLAASIGTGYPEGVNLYSELPAGVTSNAIFDPASCASTGAGAPHNNLQPYMTINYIIAYQNGLYPSPY